MNQRTTAIFGVVIMSVLIVLYGVYALQRAVALFITGTPVTILMGVGLVVIPAIGLWALGRELKFGVDTSKLVRALDASDQAPVEEIETLHSGQPVREQAQTLLPRYEHDAATRADSWVAWARLGIMQDACGDRTSGRRSMRRAIQLYKQ